MTAFRRVWCMPSADTFSMAPVVDLLKRWAVGTVVDPFARNAKWGTITNDLNPATDAQYHLPAEEFVTTLTPDCADVVLFDPPYSPRQVSEAYQSVGLTASMSDTQTARMYRLVKDGLTVALRPGGVAICFGWNSVGMGRDRGYVLEEGLLLCHGGAHNDTIITVERKAASQMRLDLEEAA